MGVAQEEAAFFELEELLAGRAGEGAVAAVCQLLVAYAAVEAGGGVAYHLVVYFGAELLGAEEGEVEVASAGRNVNQGVLEAAGPGARGGVLVELVDEDD